MANEERRFWHTLPGIFTGIAGVIGAITGMYVALKPPILDPEKPKMGPLEHGWNYDHNDLNAGGWLSIGSAEACSDLCYMNPACKAMTYVVPNRSCWLKYAVPAPIQDSTMISAVKKI